MKTVLIVDDSEFDRTLMQRLLEKRAYRVLCAADGEEALRVVGAGGVDAVLLDNLLPGIAGKDVLQKIRERHGTVDLPVIMVSGRSDAPEVVEALRLGANDYVTKPIDFQVLELRLRAVLQISGMARELTAIRAEKSALEEELALLRSRLQAS